MYHWWCEEMVTGEQFLVSADDLMEAYLIAQSIGADFACGCERAPDVYVDPEPLSEEEAEASGLDEY